MPRRRSTYSSYYPSYRREKVRKVPSLWPYLIIALAAAAGLAYFHFVAFKSLSGKVSNAYSGASMPGAPVAISAGASEPVTATIAPTIEMTTTTAADGTFHFDKIPEVPMVSVQQDGFSSQTIDATGKGTLDIKLVPNVL